MGGANVGPEFTEAEYFSLKKLCLTENEFLRQSMIDNGSELMQALEKAVVRSGRWEKWRLEDEKGKSFGELAPLRREWLVRTGCRYIWTDPQVLNARNKLYQNLSVTGIDADSQVIDEIVYSMQKYFEKFNLQGTLKRIEKELEAGL
jgi:tagatose-1,6-bisphosphate aldolase non-catalytic subunit AgaZ/GatZ